MRTGPRPQPAAVSRARPISLALVAVVWATERPGAPSRSPSARGGALRRVLRARRRQHVPVRGGRQRPGAGQVGPRRLGSLVHPAGDQHDAGHRHGHAGERRGAEGGADDDPREEGGPDGIGARDGGDHRNALSAQGEVVGVEGDHPGADGRQGDPPGRLRVDAEPVAPEVEHRQRHGDRQEADDGGEADEEVDRDGGHRLEDLLVDHDHERPQRGHAEGGGDPDGVRARDDPPRLLRSLPRQV